MTGKRVGAFRELNPGPPAPEAGIIPLDQTPEVINPSVLILFICNFVSISDLTLVVDWLCQLLLKLKLMSDNEEPITNSQ